MCQLFSSASFFTLPYLQLPPCKSDNWKCQIDPSYHPSIYIGSGRYFKRSCQNLRCSGADFLRVSVFRLSMCHIGSWFSLASVEIMAEIVVNLDPRIDTISNEKGEGHRNVGEICPTLDLVPVAGVD